jgi:hypothetical protein
MTLDKTITSRQAQGCIVRILDDTVAGSSYGGELSHGF